MNWIHQHKKRLPTALLFVVIFAAGFVVGNLNVISHAQGPFAIGGTDDAFEPIRETLDIIRDDYVDAEVIDVPMLIDAAVNGMIDSLGDQYSSYLTPETFSLFNNSLEGGIEGIGVVIRLTEEEEIEVVSLIRGAAAEAAGVRPGDIFVAVNGESVEGLNTTELGDIVRGPAGTDVTITFRRDGELLTLEITRVRFEVPTVNYEMLEGDIAYVQLLDFNQVARNQIDEALAELDVNNSNGLIFDLRGNPGGLLSVAIDVGSAFIEEGPILYEVFGDGREEIFEANGNFAGVQVPIVVLVDEGSASASELVSGAMQDLELATLIGETTFGKGTVQTLRPLSNEGALRITVARYLLPTRRWIHDVGVEPDILVEYDPFEDETDLQLEAALEFLGAQ